MKILHIPAKAVLEKIEIDKAEIAKLLSSPSKIGLVSTVQYLDYLPGLKTILENKNYSVFIAGQVLGCDLSSALDIKDKVDFFLYFGSGRFHPVGVSLETNKQVFILNPNDFTISKVDENNENQIEKIKTKKKSMMMKFLSSDIVGVLLSTKSGQKNVQGLVKEKIDKLKQKYPDKLFYFFACNTLNYEELENYPFIQSWVNTMCPRIMDDLSVLNIRDVPV